MLPTLETARLKLRPYGDADIPELVLLIGAREVAANTLRIPHPYSEQEARDFIAATHSEEDEVRLAITRTSDGRLCGGAGLRLEPAHRRAELGYWIGVPYWGNGYATEAARAMVRHGLEALELNRIFASHLKRNPASGRVLVKLGMRYEGCQREHICKWEQFVDLELYGMTRQDWQTSGKERE